MNVFGKKMKGVTQIILQTTTNTFIGTTSGTSCTIR